MKVAAVQMDIAWHDRPVNHDKAKRLAAQAREAGADLLVLPEMFSTGFSMDTSITPEPLEGATPTLLRTLARDLDMVVVGGFVLERDNGGPQNVSLAVDRNGNDLALYAKIHQIGLLGEDGSYDPGDWPVVFKLEEIYNRHFIEHLDPVEGLAFLELCHRILIEGGRFTVLCPNMKWLCEKYLAGDYSDVSEFVCWMFGGGYDAGWSYHKSAYDCDLLCRAMRTVGFEIEEYDSVGFLLEVIGVRR